MNRESRAVGLVPSPSLGANKDPRRSVSTARSLFSRWILVGTCAALLAVGAGAGSNVQAGSRPLTCEFAVSLTDDITVSSVDFRLFYPRTNVHVADASMDCRATSSSAILSAESDLGGGSPQQGELTVSLLALVAIDAPATLIRCAVTANSVPDLVEDFEFAVDDVRDAAGEPIVEPVPTLSVSSFVCGDGITTTTTTTTLPMSGSSTTTTTLVRQECEIDLTLESSPVLTRLRFLMDYFNSGGKVEGQGVAAECTTRTSHPLGATNDTGVRSLDVAVIDLDGFQGREELLRCTFVPVIFRGEPSDFNFEIVQALDENGEALSEEDEQPVVAITRFRCPGDPTTTTTSTSTTSTSTTSTTSTSTTSTTSTTVTTTSTTTSTSTTSTTLAEAQCGDADRNGKITASDALIALRTSIELDTCPLSLCDADGNGVIVASDALAILQASVEAPVDLICDGVLPGR